MVDITDDSSSFFNSIIWTRRNLFNGRRRNDFTFFDEWNFNGQRKFLLTEVSWTGRILDEKNDEHY